MTKAHKTVRGVRIEKLRWEFTQELYPERVQGLASCAVTKQIDAIVPHFFNIDCMDCLFCKIAAGEIPAQKVYEDESCVAFRDIHPQAPSHLLVIPRTHIASVAHANEADKELLGHLTLVAAQLARQQGLASGFRIVMNAGEEGGQTVHHLHLHLLGGRQMHWPPG